MRRWIQSVRTKHAQLFLFCLVGGVTLAVTLSAAGQGPGFRGGRGDPTFSADRDVFQFLLAHHEKIRRQVKNRQDGVETLTESDDPKIAAKIEEHVAAMYARVDEQRPIRRRDPLFRELFQHAAKIEMHVEKTDKGLRVVETSQDPYVVRLIQEHAQVVSGFVKKGFAEAHRNHAVPDPRREDSASAERAEMLKATALDAKDELFIRLSSRLLEAMSEGGAANAITVCSQEASSIANEVGRAKGVSIGRTAFRLRNADNKPPKWAEPLVRDRVEVPHFAELPDGRFAALLPIHLQTKCLTCHGPTGTIAEDTKLALAARYPHDQATGFEEGDLRGWFWVEIPARVETD